MRPLGCPDALRLLDQLKPKRRCANCGRAVRGLEWRGKVFCSSCKREYSGKRKKPGGRIFLPSYTFEALHWRR